MRFVWFAILLFVAGCPADPPVADDGLPIDRCRGIVCGVEGTGCDPTDGLCHCGAGGPVCGDTDTCGAGVCVPAFENRCTMGTRWVENVPSFRETTVDWGLVDVGAMGTRLAVADVDGDGWADLLVRRGGNVPDDFTEGGTRRTWLLRNDGAKKFVDITVPSGIRATRIDQGRLGRPGEVVAFGDVDNDGDLDLYTGMTTGIDDALVGETSELLYNDGDGNFVLGPIENPIRRPNDPDIVAGASFIDYDRDGGLDLFVGQHNYTPAGRTNVVFQHDLLYRNLGAGFYADVTEEVGLVTEDWRDLATIDAGLAHSRAWSAAACDLNDDGTPELLAASYGRAPNHLWRGVRDESGAVTFVNESVASGYAFDDNQMWQDNEFARCHCAQNPTDVGCDQADPPRINCSTVNWRHAQDRRAFRLGGNSGTTVCADIDDDGHIDLLTTEITHWWAGSNADRSELLLNTGAPEVRLMRPGLRATGLERGNPSANWDNGDMTAAVLDFDNDGRKDVYIGASDYPGNRGLLFHQGADGAFVQVGVADGIEHNRSHGVVVADFDRDGDLDLIVGHSRARCSGGGAAPCYDTAQVRFFENVIGEHGNWVQLDLEGITGTNRAAIGARVQVTTSEGTQTFEVGGGHGHYGIQHDLVVHAGLGTACEAEITVRWPNAELSTDTFSVQAGYRYDVKQGQTPEPQR